MPIYKNAYEITPALGDTNKSLSKVLYIDEQILQQSEIISLGTGTSFNVASVYPNYANLTVDNFYILDSETFSETGWTAKQVYSDRSNGQAITNLTKTYDPSTGILTCYVKYKHYYTDSNNNGPKNYDKNINVQAYLIINEPIDLGTAQSFDVASVYPNYANLTVDDFYIKEVTEFSEIGWTAKQVYSDRSNGVATSEIVKSYDASTGVLTCYLWYKWYYTDSNNNGPKNYDKKQDVHVYLPRTEEERLMTERVIWESVANIDFIQEGGTGTITADRDIKGVLICSAYNNKRGGSSNPDCSITATSTGSKCIELSNDTWHQNKYSSSAGWWYGGKGNLRIYLVECKAGDTFTITSSYSGSATLINCGKSNAEVITYDGGAQANFKSGIVIGVGHRGYGSSAVNISMSNGTCKSYEQISSTANGTGKRLIAKVSGSTGDTINFSVTSADYANGMMKLINIK